MTIALAKDVEEYLAQQVRAGISSSASDLLNDLVRSVRDQQRLPFAVTPELEAWLLEAADKPAIPLTSRDFVSIRERVRARQKHSAS
jgi:Arc/MetJ-type ribon-helix-helix transcriptional regulator